MPTMLEMAYLAADQGDIDKAFNISHEIIAIDNLADEAYFLLGVLSEKRGDNKKAADYFNKVLYCDERHFVARYHLACIYKNMGQAVLARQELINTVKVINKIIESGSNKVLAGHSAAYILSLCSDLLATEKV